MGSLRAESLSETTFNENMMELIIGRL